MSLTFWQIVALIFIWFFARVFMYKLSEVFADIFLRLITKKSKKERHESIENSLRKLEQEGSGRNNHDGIKNKIGFM